MLAELLYISVSVVRVCLCPKALLSLCLILSLIIVHLFSKLLFCAQMSNLLSKPPFITSHHVNVCTSISNFLGLCCEGICDRQTIYIQTTLKINSELISVHSDKNYFANEVSWTEGSGVTDSIAVQYMYMYSTYHYQVYIL